FGCRGCAGCRTSQCRAQAGGRQWNRAGCKPVADHGTGRVAAMKLALTIDGRADTIEILVPVPACRFQLGDAGPRDANVESPEPGVYSVLLDGRSYDAFVEDTAAGLVVTIEGQRFEVEVRDPRRWSRRSAGAGAGTVQSILSPM